jgi:hypothetical protein
VKYSSGLASHIAFQHLNALRVEEYPNAVA